MNGTVYPNDENEGTSGTNNSYESGSWPLTVVVSFISACLNALLDKNKHWDESNYGRRNIPSVCQNARLLLRIFGEKTFSALKTIFS